MTDTLAGSMSSDELFNKLTTLVGKLPEPRLSRENTALLVIDMQYLDAHPDYGIGNRAKKLGIADFLDYYWSRIGELTIPNIQRLLSAARQAGIEVIHTKIAAQTLDGRESTWPPYKSELARKHAKDAKETEILRELAPQGDEIVISKLAASAFSATNVDWLLRNMSVRNVIMCGVTTNACVEASARSVADLNYAGIVVDDATAAFAPQLQEHSILNMGHKDALIKTTDEVVELLQAI